MAQTETAESLDLAVRAAWSQSFKEPLEPDRSLFEAVLPEQGVFRTVRIQSFITALNAASGLALPITAVCAADTPRKLSLLVRRRENPPTSRPMLARPGSGPALFVLPGLGGMGLDLLELMEGLRYAGPVYLNVASGIDYREPVLTTIDALVDDHLAMLRRMQPAGPYLMLGYSWGALVAIEVARRLQSEGEQVSFLGAIDPYLSEAHWPIRTCLRYAGRRLRHHLNEIRRMGPAELFAYGLARGQGLIGRVGRKIGMRRPLNKSPFDQDGLPGEIGAVWWAEVGISERLRMRFFDGKMTLFLSQGGAAAECDADIVWRRYIRSVPVHWLEGDHLALMRQPLVRQLAERISDCLERASGAAGEQPTRSEKMAAPVPDPENKSGTRIPSATSPGLLAAR